METSVEFGEKRCQEIAKHQAYVTYHRLKSMLSPRLFNTTVAGIVAPDNMLVPVEIRNEQYRLIDALVDEMFCNIVREQQEEIRVLVRKMWWSVFKTQFMLLKVEDTLV